LTLNRFLYANANPATLVDPDGHFAGDLDDERRLVSNGTIKRPMISARRWADMSRKQQAEYVKVWGPYALQWVSYHRSNLLFDSHIFDIADEYWNGVLGRGSLRLGDFVSQADMDMATAWLAHEHYEDPEYNSVWNNRMGVVACWFGVTNEGGGDKAESYFPSDKGSPEFRQVEVRAEVDETVGGLTKVTRQRAGYELETQVRDYFGIDKNTARIDTEPGVTVIPESIDRGIWEVKNRSYVTVTDQIRGESEVARSSNLPYFFVVGPGTQAVSKGVVEEVYKSGGVIFRMDASGNVTTVWRVGDPIERIGFGG
jgi:hypothetical protein